MIQLQKSNNFMFGKLEKEPFIYRRLAIYSETNPTGCNEATKCELMSSTSIGLRVHSLKHIPS